MPSIRQLEKRLAKMSKKLGFEHPDVQELKRHIEQIRGSNSNISGLPRKDGGQFPHTPR